MESVKRIFNIASSIIGITEEKLERLDIQEYNIGGFNGYSGYLHTDRNVYLIRSDGTFEWKA